MQTLKLSENVRQFLSSYNLYIKNRRGDDYKIHFIEIFLFLAMVLYAQPTVIGFSAICVYGATFLCCALIVFYTFKLIFLTVNTKYSSEEKIAYQAYIFWVIQHLKQFNRYYFYVFPVAVVALFLIKGFLLLAVLVTCSLGLLFSIQKSCFQAALEVEKAVNAKL